MIEVLNIRRADVWILLVRSPLSLHSRGRSNGRECSTSLNVNCSHV